MRFKKECLICKELEKCKPNFEKIIQFANDCTECPYDKKCSTDCPDYAELIETNLELLKGGEE